MLLATLSYYRTMYSQRTVQILLLICRRQASQLRQAECG